MTTLNANRQWPSSAVNAAGSLNARRFLVYSLLALLVGAVAALIFLPWQQSVRGEGRVIAYAPLERQQAVEAPIEGRVVRWFVQEGDVVEAGAPIAQLADNDPMILARLEREREATEAQLDAIDVSIALSEANILSLRTARDSAIANARHQVEMARDREQATQRSVDAAAAKQRTAKVNLDRLKELHERGLTSSRDYELAQLAEQTARADLERYQASLRAAQNEIKAKSSEEQRTASSSQASIDATRSSLEKLRAERAKVEAELPKIDVRLTRQAQMQIVAPRAGTVFRLVAKEGAEMVKAGDPLVILVPKASSHAVELYLDGNNIPLVEAGDVARLQFEGWPAVQFVGWPSVAVGTFPAEVAFVDAHDDGTGQFRVVLVPQQADQWPSDRYLRQGVRANGWILLNQVPIGYELWRIFNGFPPTTAAPKASTEAKK